MGWQQKITEPEPPHPCKVPSDTVLERERVLAGSTWKCEECQALWRFQGWGHGFGAEQGESWSKWERLAQPRPQPVFGGFQGRPAAVRDDPSTQPGGGAVQQQWER